MKHIVVGTAGHIDHGKSALVQALTGVDPDRLKEERTRGITIDLGFARYQDGETDLAFVDVPGHERFVRNMLAGASGIDFVLLVIAADTSVMPQTKEHLDICRLLGVPSGIIAITKSDLVDDDIVDLVQLETEDLVAGSFLQAAPIVPVSARTGEGLPQLRSALRDVAGEVVGRPVDGLPRLPIDRAFTLKGFGTVVTGTQVSGRIDHETDLVLLPSERAVRVRGLQVHGESRKVSLAGQRVALNLGGVEVEELRRGDTLTTVDSMRPTTRIDCEVALLSGARELKYGARVRFHQGTTEVMARIAIGANCDAVEGEPDLFPSTLMPGIRNFVRLHLERPIAVTRDDRFVLRTYSPTITVAGGVVLDPHPGQGRLRTKAGVSRLRRLADTEKEALAVIVWQAGGQGISGRALVSRVGRPLEVVREQLGSLITEGVVCQVGDVFVAKHRIQDISSKLQKMVEEYHRDNPLGQGLPREEARERLSRYAGAELFQHGITCLVEDGTLVAGPFLVAANHQIVLSEEETAIKKRLEELFLERGLAPPELKQVAIDEVFDKSSIDRMVTLLIREGILERVSGLLFHTVVLERLRIEMLAFKKGRSESVPLEMQEFKHRFGVSRKYAIPLLEYLDGVHVTRRVGNGRVVV
jgi:selenocysteine-specific elongation factor